MWNLKINLKTIFWLCTPITQNRVFRQLVSFHMLTHILHCDTTRKWIEGNVLRSAVVEYNWFIGNTSVAVEYESSFTHHMCLSFLYYTDLYILYVYHSSFLHRNHSYILHNTSLYNHHYTCISLFHLVYHYPIRKKLSDINYILSTLVVPYIIHGNNIISCIILIDHPFYLITDTLWLEQLKLSATKSQLFKSKTITQTPPLTPFMYPIFYKFYIDV